MKPAFAMLRRVLGVSAFLTVLSAPVLAQVPLLDLRVGAHAALPQGDFADTHDAGVGAYFRAGLPVLVVKLMGSVTYTQFRSGNPFIDDVSEITLQLGPHYSPVPALDLGAELAYLTDAQDWAFSPNVSVGFLMLEATASYNKPLESSTSSWFTVGLGLRF